MNNIYKVIWSKAKNCYVVASEIARSHTKSASGSEKIGGGTRRKLLASLMALSLLCGGLGVASAEVDVKVEVSSAPGAVEVYTKAGVDALLDGKADKTALAGKADKGNVDANKAAIQTLETGKANTSLNNLDEAGKSVIKTTMTDELEKKADKSALNDKANTSLNNLDEAGKSVIKATMAADMASKANQNDLEAATNRITANEGKITDLQKKTANLSDDGTKLTGMTTVSGTTVSGDNVEAGALKVTGGISDGAGVTTTLADIKASMTQTATNKDDIANLKTKTDGQQGTIDELKQKTAEISHEDGEGTKISGVTIKDGNIVGNGNSAITQLANVGTLSINGKNLEGAMVATEKEVADAVKAETDARKEADNQLEEKITKNSRDIATLDGSGVKYDSDVKDKITLKGPDGTKITHLKDATLSDVSTDAVTGRQLNQTNKDLKTEAQTREDMDTLLSGRADALEKNTGGITRNDAKDETYIEKNVTVDNQGNIEAKGKVTANGVDADAGDITTKGAVNSGTLEVTNTSHFKGDVTMDNKLNVTGNTLLNNTDVGGVLNVTGASNLKGDVTLGTPNGTNTVTVNGTANFQETVKMNNGLNVTNGETNLKNTTVTGDLKVTGTITTDTMVFGVKPTNYTEIDQGKVTSKNSYINGAGQSITSSSTFDVEKNEVGFVNNATGEQSYHKQTAKGINGSVTDKDGNTTYTKVTATENSFQVQDKDGKNKNHQVNTKDSSVTEITNAAGATTKTEQTAENITNTAKDGTIKNDAKDIVNNASGNISNKSQTMDTTVTGKATESYGSLDTTVNGNETHIVKGTKTETVDGKVTENYNAGQATKVTGNQDIHVTGKQTNTVEGGQENIISGGQINSITGDQTTTVTGDISNKAENITNEANTKLTDKVGDNTRVLDSEGITDTVPGADGKGSTFKQRIDAIMGNVKTDAGESEVTQKGDEITSVVGKGEATNSRVTQKKGSLEAGVTDGTNTNASYDVADASAKVLTGGTKVNKLQDNLDSSEKTITNGVYTTSKLQTALDITNTAKDGTITNDAKNIVNNATGDMTNTVGGKLTTTVTGQATENFKGGLKTDITGEEIHTVTGNQTNKVTGKQTNTVEGGQENIISGGQINNITGDQTTTISGTQTTTARDINRNASSGMIDTIDNAYGTNTETKVAGKTTTDVSIKGTGEKGQYIRGANESRDYLIKGTLKNSETKTAEATSTEITDGNGKTSSTIQDVTQISGSVTDGTNTSVSNVKANSIDSAVTDGSSISTINQKKNSITSQVTDGTTITKTEQDTKNITNTAKDGTITNDAKDIVNNASGNMTNTVGGDLTTTVRGNELHEVTGKQTNKIDGNQENTIGGNQTTTVTGDISNKAENITNEANTKLTDKVGENTRVLDSEGITDTVGGSTFKQRIDKIMMESKDVSIKAEETLTNEAKVITNKASEVINNEAVNINNTATGIITSKASEIKNQADKLISNKVGENTWENMENGKITTSIKDGAKQNLTQSDAAGTTQSTVDGGKSTVTIQNADGLADAVTDGTNTSVQNQTASAIAAAVKDGAGNENASVANATTSVNTIKSGSKANTVISTADGTSFINSEAAAPVGDGTEVKTTIKGNTITTGKVTMDYAEVMKDLGVRGNANITGKTTTGSLEVTGTSTLKGDVTMGSNATVKKDLTVEGNTNLKNTKVDGTLDVTQKATFGDSVSIAKDLSVDGNATIKGDVTAKSYKVGDKTYISAAGINANDQKITNVADGSISEGSKDAVNGGQLYTVKNDLEGKVNKVGANAAAMANLHPMEFDPDSKWNIAAAMGNYGSETATAIGAFYRPNEDVMVNFSTAFGTGENMVGGGVSVRLGKGSNKLSREESNALKDQVNDLTARMDALLSVLNPNMSKDFPDVPENHWAYEAVSRLAGNDIVQGYPDGEFHGERTMTRYEMAEIIYNALSRGAEAERELVEEFKPELQAMAASEKSTAEKAEG